jgi:hypothetical protein
MRNRLVKLLDRYHLLVTCKTKFPEGHLQKWELRDFSLIDCYHFGFFYGFWVKELIGDTLISLPPSGDLQNQVS